MDKETQNSPESHRKRWTRFLGTLLAVGLVCGLLVGGLVYFFRDPLPLLTQQDLDAAYQQWETNRPENYDLDVQISGVRSALVHVEVRDGKVSQAPTFDGKPVQRKHTWETWSIDGQFDTLHREMELSEDPQREMDLATSERLVLKAEFDSQYGYPVQYRRIASGTAPSITWKVVHFQALK